MRCFKVNILLIILTICITLFAGFEDRQIFEYKGTVYEYSRPRLPDPFKRIVPDYLEYAGLFTQKNSLITYSLVAVSTAVLIIYDQELIDEAKDLGRDLNINSKDMTQSFITIGGIPVFRGPTDLGSSLYFLGDGWLHGSIMTGFLTYGLIKDDNRALQTASQLVEGLITTGIATQVLKHITGRQSPYRSTEEGGKWDFFPDQIDYHEHVSSYDAFPSGHLATAMMTFTVITENYPEYNRWVKPVGWTLMGLLSFQMMNNGVHWASDYPLALAIGYGFGRIAADNGRRVVSDHDKTAVRFVPYYKNDAIGLGIKYNLSIK